VAGSGCNYTADGSGPGILTCPGRPTVSCWEAAKPGEPIVICVLSQHISRCCLPNGCVWKTELSFVKVLKFGVSFLLAFFRSTHNILCLSICRYINERFIPVGLLDFLLLSQPNALVMNAH
jgi:hypothetical protein